MMNQEGIFKKVGQILNELQDQYDFLARNPGQLNDLELELFLANANFLSDHVQIVKKFNSNKPLKEIPEHSEDQSDLAAAAIEPAPATLSKSYEIEDAPEQSETIEPEKELRMEKEKTLEELEAEYAAVREPEPEPKEKEEDQPEALKFEFSIDNNVGNDKFEFEQQPVETIFDRPLSKEEEEIIAEKQRLRDNNQAHPLNETIEEVVSPIAVVQHITPEPVQVIREEPEAKVIEQPVPVAPVVNKPVEQPEERRFVQPVSAPPVIPVYEKPVEIVLNEPDLPQARPTLNDMLAGAKNNAPSSLNEENSSKPKITDLKQAINLNEKLLYIKDLFNGYNLAYAEAIELINKMPDFKTADNFLRNNYAEKNNWSAKQGTVDKFYDLLNQRFEVK